MISIFTPEAVRFGADRIKDLFPEVKYLQLTAIISLFLLNKPTVSSVTRDLPYVQSVSTICRGIRAMRPNRLMRRLRHSVLRRLKEKLNNNDFAFVVDDTGNPKTGVKIFRTGYWGGSGGVYHGQKVLVISLVNLKSKESIPLEYVILPKRESSQSPKIFWHALRALKALQAAGFPPLTVVCDSWFSSVAFMSSLEQSGFHSVMEIKANRKVGINPGSHVPWISLPQAFVGQQRLRTVTNWDDLRVKRRTKKGKCIAERHLLLRNRKTPVKVVAVYNRRNGKQAYGYFASTDQRLSRARIWLLSRSRWSIECIFKTCKQFLSFGKLSCEGEEAAHLAVALPLYLYALLTMEDPRHFGLTKREPLSMMIKKIQERSFASSISAMLHRPVQEKLTLLKNRRKLETTHRKPTNRPAGSPS